MNTAIELYDSGRYTEAVEHLSQILEKNNNSYAKYLLSECLINGNGIEKNIEKGMKYLQESAAMGEIDAQLEYAGCLGRGQFVEQNYEESYKLYQHAASKDNEIGQYNVGVCMYFGNGTERDIEKGLKIIKKHAKAGNSEAQCIMGDAYLNGEGLEKNDLQASTWYRKSSEQENCFGMIKYAMCLLEGIGVTQNKDLGLELMQKASSLGSESATEYLKSNVG